MIRVLFIAIVLLLSDDKNNLNSNGILKSCNVLIYSKTAAYRHSNIESAVKDLKDYLVREGLEVTVSESDSVIDSEILKEFDVVVFLNTTGDIFNEAQQQIFRKWYQGGKGFVGIHSATDTEYEWPWYHQLVGGYFVNHPPGTSDGIIEIVEPNHISTVMLPQPWVINEEWYNLRDLVPGTLKLLNLQESSIEGGSMGENHPLAWYREFDSGRTWYTAMGHKAETFRDELFLKHILGGILYAAGQE